MQRGRHCYMSLASALHCKANDDWPLQLSRRIESEHEPFGRFRGRDGQMAFAGAVDVCAGPFSDRIGEGWRKRTGGLRRTVQDQDDRAAGAGENELAARPAVVDKAGGLYMAGQGESAQRSFCAVARKI